MEIIKFGNGLDTNLVNSCVDLELETHKRFGHRYSHEIWSFPHFLYPLREKWNFSRFALEKEQLVGFWIASKKEDSAHVHRVAIDQINQRKGIGNRLFEAFFQEVSRRGVKGITVSASAENLPALAFYKKKQFRVMTQQRLYRFLSHRKNVCFDAQTGLITEPGGYHYYCLYRIV